jgi:hypothetical protein
MGDDFVEVIAAAAGNCDVLSAHIANRWLTIISDDRRRGLDDPNDFASLEIETGLTRNVRVIAAPIDAAQLPHSAELPPSLAKIVCRRALQSRLQPRHCRHQNAAPARDTSYRVQHRQSYDNLIMPSIFIFYPQPLTICWKRQ